MELNQTKISKRKPTAIRFSVQFKGYLKRKNEINTSFSIGHPRNTLYFFMPWIGGLGIIFSWVY